ncbi:HEAT repeat domain-containing protein [Streptomyces sp. NBC_00178]|uniref:HEAT repeat domain-containing protein n=1 Tax=Streptomyces sp. NBC_00178 TaxID=2975672 RepID=UPI002E29BAB8|nr:HEAT repeat domain-containing protein [Streptomyces sp. NBC_00178]
MSLPRETVVAQLGDKASAKRRSAARRLGRSPDVTAGPALLDALRRETGDPRTWETQYEMVMALGACAYGPAVGFLSELARRPTEHTALHVALGDALVRLRGPGEGAAALEWCLGHRNPALADGAFRAVAALAPPLDATTVDRVLDFLDPLDRFDGLRYWAAVAARDWPGDRVRAFLDSCAAGPRADVADAAAASLERRRR